MAFFFFKIRVRVTVRVRVRVTVRGAELKMKKLDSQSVTRIGHTHTRHLQYHEGGVALGSGRSTHADLGCAHLAALVVVTATHEPF